MDGRNVQKNEKERKRKRLACHTPTTALAMRISKMTKGSTNAVI